MTQRRPTDGWLCKNCGSVFFTKENICPWCYRDLGQAESFYSPALRKKLHKITGRLRRVVERDGWTCWLCKEGVEPFDLGVHRASVDHVLPRSMGGGDELSNLKLAHASCNEYRSGSKTVPYAPFDNRWVADHIRREALG